MIADPALPVVVFGGPYSNREATVSMQNKAAALGIPAGNVVCTGDVVAYAANPEETATLVRDWGIHVVAGNCEEQLAAGADDCGCGFEEGSACDLLSKGWYPYANASISDATRAWMAALPPYLSFDYHGVRIHALHGGAAQNNTFLFASDAGALEQEASAIDADLILAGHAGIPFIASVGARKTWLNAGVIGVPANDGTPDGWYALIEPAAEGLRLSLHRLAYDHISAAAAMRRAGHANGYAKTLITGIWPSHDVLPATERAATGVALAETSMVVERRVEVV